jgi:hypothetical protein
MGTIYKYMELLVCRQISPIVAALVIKYEILPIKIAATKLIDESGLQEINPRL